MIRYYTNRQLSGRFNINLAKWKRWSREFLPPDPLGGHQSGYARQYTQDDAFTVYLGGHLVADLRFTIPETKRILTDLSTWLGENGFYKNSGVEHNGVDDIFKMIDIFEIFICSGTDGSGNQNGFTYAVRGIISKKSIKVKGYAVEEVQYLEKILKNPDGKKDQDAFGGTKLLHITDIFRRFCNLLKVKLAYSVLN
jgi:hypothetical protein